MASPTRWTWVWVNSGSWWWTGTPGMLQFMGSQRVGHDWLNWTELIQIWNRLLYERHMAWSPSHPPSDSQTTQEATSLTCITKWLSTHAHTEQNENAKTLVQKWLRSLSILFFFFVKCLMGILVPWAGDWTHAIRSPNHCTTMEFPMIENLKQQHSIKPSVGPF